MSSKNNKGEWRLKHSNISYLFEKQCRNCFSSDKMFKLGCDYHLRPYINCIQKKLARKHFTFVKQAYFKKLN